MSLYGKSKVIAIVKKELAPLMKIIGIDTIFVAENRNDALNVLEKAVKDRDIGVVVIQRSLAKDISLLEFQSIGLYPSIITIPDSSEDLSEPPKAFYRDLIRRFIGYEVYLE
uniref:V-type ATP synthase subunit F n=1 Tax=Ignisphaera aggregans TaxID=334771 RepID=A0A7C5UT59_9CREN